MSMDMTPGAGPQPTAVADRPFDWADSDDPTHGNHHENVHAGGSGGRTPSRRWRQRLPGSKRTRWLILVVALVVILLAPSAWSYGQALAAPGNTSLGVRSVDWLRDHHFRWLVNDVENFWYSHHKPKKGGNPAGSLARTFDRAAAAPTLGNGGPSGAGSAGRALTPRHLPAPAPIPPIVTPPIAGEGQWQPLGQTVGGVPAMYAAYLRPDPVYTSVVTGVAWIDPTLVRAVLYGGVQEPGGTGWQYQGTVAPQDRPNLLAAFNSGFKLRDSAGGYFAEGRVVRPLRPGVASLLIRADGTATVGVLGRDFQMGSDVAFVRQNLALIVDNGQPAPDLTQSSSKWGATLGNKVLVWRSAIGVTADGGLLFAGGNNLSIVTLAHVMARAGAVRAMELDINPGWVHFNTYGPPAPGQPASAPSVKYLLPGMGGPINRYVRSLNSRDFIALFRRG